MSKLWARLSGKLNPTSQMQAEADDLLRIALEIHKRAIKMKADHEKILIDQLIVSDELRSQRRRNHFAEMFVTPPKKLDRGETPPTSRLIQDRNQPT